MGVRRPYHRGSGFAGTDRPSRVAWTISRWFHKFGRNGFSSSRSRVLKQLQVAQLPPARPRRVPDMERDVVPEMTPIAERENVRVDRAERLALARSAGRVQVGHREPHFSLRPHRWPSITLDTPARARRRPMQATVPEALTPALGPVEPDPAREHRPVRGVAAIHYASTLRIDASSSSAAFPAATWATRARTFPASSP